MRKKLVCVGMDAQGPRGDGRRPAAGQDVYLAIDLSRSKWVYGLRWDQQQQRVLSSAGALEHLQALVAQYAECKLHVVYEACGFGYEIAWWLLEEEIDVMVMAPSTVERAPGLRVKTDRIDVREMARKLEEKQLKGIYIPTRAIHERRQPSRTYAQAMQDRKRSQARVRSFMQEQGHLGPAPMAGWTAYEQWLDLQDLPAHVAPCVAELRGMRATAVASSRRLKQRLLEVAREPAYAHVVEVLAQQQGVGVFTAIRFVLEIGAVARFATADSIVNYLGLTPSQYSSGELDHRGHLLKTGPGPVRAWIVQCAWASLRGPNADARLVRCFERLVPRMGKKRAIVAVARRLALRLRARWLEALVAPPAVQVA